MSVIQGNAFADDDAVDTGDIGHSLRCRSAASAYLSKTFGSAADRRKYTVSFWFRRSRANNTIENVFTTSNDTIRFNDDAPGDQLRFVLAGATLRPARQFRDPTAWNHCVVAVDTTQATSTDRVKIYIRGEQETAFTAVAYPSLNADGDFGNNVAHAIGALVGPSQHYDGYLSRFCFVGGSQLTPSSFGYLNTEINEWVSKTQSEVKAVVDAGGTNSFMLDFDDATSLTTLGYDKSSKGNNWTLNNFSLTAGTTYDHMLDVPGNSYATLNPSYPSAANITNGNLSSGTTAARGTLNSTVIDSQWFVTAGASAVTAGVIDDSGTTNTTSVTANKVFAFKMTTAGALSYKNVTDAGSWTSIATGLTGNRWPYSVTQAASWNFGQQPLPEALDTGFLALCQANLPTPAILNPELHMDVVTVTKSGDTNFTIPWSADTYDTFFEIKRRDASGDWYQIDGLRGYDKILKSNSTAAETTDANVLGVSGTTGTLKSTLADGTYVVTMHKAGLVSARQTNTDGSITSTVSANVEAGFSIVTYTGTGANATVGHGLGKAPKMVVVKKRSAAGDNWPVYHSARGAGEYGYLNSTNAFSTASAIQIWNNTAPTSTVVSIGTESGVNGNTATYVAYCHADIEGYSKAFSYTGNGSADGPFVHLGFKPKWVLIKRSDAAEDWRIVDAVRTPANPAGAILYPNISNAELTPTFSDLLASGFKIRSTDGAFNASGGTYIGMAYADVAGKYSLGR